MQDLPSSFAKMDDGELLDLADKGQAGSSEGESDEDDDHVDDNNTKHNDRKGIKRPPPKAKKSFPYNGRMKKGQGVYESTVG